MAKKTKKVSPLWGAAAVAAGGTAGVIVGAASDAANPNSLQLGALTGASWGVLLTGGVGLFVAAVSPKYRTAAYTAAGITGALLTVSLVSAVLRLATTPTPQVTSGTP